LQLLLGFVFLVIGSVNTVVFLPQRGRDIADRVFGVIPLVFVGMGLFFLLDYLARHLLAIRSGRILLTRQLGPFAVGREYDLTYVRSFRRTSAPVRVQPSKEQDEPALAFDYGNRTVYFAKGIAPGAADSVVIEAGRIAPAILRSEPAESLAAETL
jgi:hypothetical protein